MVADGDHHTGGLVLAGDGRPGAPAEPTEADEPDKRHNAGAVGSRACAANAGRAGGRAQASEAIDVGNRVGVSELLDTDAGAEPPGAAGRTGGFVAVDTSGSP